MNIVSLFTGGGIFDYGLKGLEGVNHLFGVELKPDICNVAIQNGILCLNHDVTTFPFQDYINSEPNWIHASPPCLRASLANHRKSEDDEDVKLISSVLFFLYLYEPEYFSFENVQNYRNFKAFEYLKDNLKKLGYHFVTGTVDFSKLGVPQRRKRLLLMARKNGEPKLPLPEENEVGWFSAIEDLIPELEYSHIPKWVNKRLVRAYGEEYMDVLGESSWLIPNGNASSFRVYDKLQPSITVTSNMGKKGAMPKIIHDGKIFKMNSKCLARLQTIPDDYIFSGNNNLDIEIIGNGVPCLASRKLVLANL